MKNDQIDPMEISALTVQQQLFLFHIFKDTSRLFNRKHILLQVSRYLCTGARKMRPSVQYIRLNMATQSVGKVVDSHILKSLIFEIYTLYKLYRPSDFMTLKTIAYLCTKFGYETPANCKSHT